MPDYTGNFLDIVNLQIYDVGNFSGIVNLQAEAIGKNSDMINLQKDTLAKIGDIVRQKFLILLPAMQGIGLSQDDNH